MTEWGDTDSFCTEYGFYNENPSQDIITRQDKNTLPVPYHEEQIPLFDAASLELLVSGETIQVEGSFTRESGNHIRGTKMDDTESRTSHKLSTEQILKLAGERFVQFSSEKFTNMDMFSHPYGSSLLHLSTEDKRDVELAQLLLAAADKVSSGQFERAGKLLVNCRRTASSTGTPVQRVVFYFAEALMERINGGKGKLSEEEGNTCADACMKPDVPAFISMYSKIPFYQILHLTAVQTILENVATASKVHIVDFHLMTGLHWAALMKCFAEKTTGESRYLKITSVVTEEKHLWQETGKLLRSFARLLNLPFSYKVVSLTNMKDLKEEDFDSEPDEGVAVFFPFKLRTLISKPACLKNLMMVVQKIKPLVTVVEEVESNHNSPSFVNRFIESLFYYGALFDSLEDSMTRDDVSRMALESGPYRDGLCNIVATEGTERETRSISLQMWRAFFVRFGMKEMDISTASHRQASMILNQFPCGESCTLDASNKCLLVGWKGTPLYSLSAWKFH